MSERYATWIKIGGTITNDSDVQLFFESLRLDYTCLEYGDSRFMPQQISELVDICEPDEGHVLWLVDEHSTSGEFPNIEETCRRIGLPYHRFSESGSGVDAVFAYWVPEMPEPYEYITSMESPGRILIPADIVLNKLAQEAENLSDYVANLGPLTRPPPPPLPPFQVEIKS